MSNRRRVITIQNVDDRLWSRVQDFMLKNRRIPSISALARTGLENYLDLAERYEIDKDWKLQIGEPVDGTIKTG